VRLGTGGAQNRPKEEDAGRFPKNKQRCIDGVSEATEGRGKLIEPLLERALCFIIRLVGNRNLVCGKRAVLARDLARATVLCRTILDKPLDSRSWTEHLEKRSTGRCYPAARKGDLHG
jgi:hypothetical protein